MAKVKTKVYLHSSKEEMLDEGVAAGLCDDALATFMYALYEVEFELEVDTVTGDYRILNIEEC